MACQSIFLSYYKAKSNLIGGIVQLNPMYWWSPIVTRFIDYFSGQKLSERLCREVTYNRGFYLIPLHLIIQLIDEQSGCAMVKRTLV